MRSSSNFYHNPRLIKWISTVNLEPENVSSLNDIKLNGQESIGTNTDFAIGKTTYRCIKDLKMIKNLACST